MQRNYMLQEQLKIIKKELGIEVCNINIVLFAAINIGHRKMIRML